MLLLLLKRLAAAREFTSIARMQTRASVKFRELFRGKKTTSTTLWIERRRAGTTTSEQQVAPGGARLDSLQEGRNLSLLTSAQLIMGDDRERPIVDYK